MVNNIRMFWEKFFDNLERNVVRNRAGLFGAYEDIIDFLNKGKASTVAIAWSLRVINMSSRGHPFPQKHAYLNTRRWKTILPIQYLRQRRGVRVNEVMGRVIS